MTITFLPYSDFEKTARCLDDQRLGSSKKEGWIILNAIRKSEEPKYSKISKAGYCLMWKGYEDALAYYLNILMLEWARRGKKNDKIKPYDKANGLDKGVDSTNMPPWLGNETLHSYHRHALLAKSSKHYKQFGWKENGKDYIGSYMWPVQLDDGSWIFRWPKAVGRDPVTIIRAMSITTPTKSANNMPRVVTPPAATTTSKGNHYKKRQKESKRNVSKRWQATKAKTNGTSRRLQAMRLNISNNRMKLRSDTKLLSSS